jgi:hypothetical protein
MISDYELSHARETFHPTNLMRWEKCVFVMAPRSQRDVVEAQNGGWVQPQEPTHLGLFQ